MTMLNDHYQSLLKLLLPSELFDYFEITNLVVDDRSVAVFLEERDIKPKGYQNKKLTSKGFHPEAIIQDFPIRNKAVFLHVRRRRWFVEPGGEVISKDWNLIAEGTRYTQSFANFLKELLG